MSATRSERLRKRRSSPAAAQVRVAVYTRKSVTQGLDQEFSSIAAQREAVEAYVTSQRGAGWVALAERYDDGGYSGANTDRPAFQRLLADIAAGKVDCVGVYRIDRLSRSFADYVAILKLFQKHGVTFVSVTEQFNTTTPTGRLVLNQLILFSQFEREVIAERIRDKIRATRRRGMWTGGRPVLGYDVVDSKLVINATEAEQVRDMFALYLEHGSLRGTVAELARRGWLNKSFRSKGGRHNAGGAFTKATLHATLTNVLYRGQVRCGDEAVDGVHEPIVDAALWDAVHERLRSNGSDNGAHARNATGAILRGLLRCGRCGSAMVHTFTNRGTRRYRYYVCARHHNEGASACPDARVPAGEFEGFVVEQIKVIGRDHALASATLARATEAMVDRRQRLSRELRRAQRAPQRGDGNDPQAGVIEDRRREIEAELRAIGDGTIDEDDLHDALQGFTPIWGQLFPREQERILRLLIERVTYDPASGDVDIQLRPAGIEALAEEANDSCN